MTCSRFLPCALLLLSAGLSAQAPDVILHNGRILTVDEAFSIREALAVRGDRLAAVGGEEEVLRLRGPRTRVIDLKGKTVLPGLMDSHTHSVSAAMYEFDHPVPDMETIGDVLNYFRERARAVPEGEWIVLEQVFITRLREQRYPTRQELDQAAPRHPVVFRTGPDASVNSLALKLSGIDKDFRITDGRPGRIERDANGEPTGILRAASRLIKAKNSRPKPTLADKERRLAQLIADYNSLGMTSIADRDAGDDDVAVYRALFQKNGLHCRVFLNYSVDAQAAPEEIEARIRKGAADPLHRPNPMLWLRGIKVYLDGGMLTGSAYMRKPWGVSKVYSIDDPEYRGMRYIAPGRLYFILRTAMKNGLQPTAHSVGDGAVHAMLDAYAEINNEFPVRDHRPCITHSNFMSREAIDQMKQLGVVADLQPAWLERDGATLLKQFGDDRLTWFQPYKSLFEAGVTVGGGSDHMQKIGGLRSINPYNPWFGMWIALTRQPRWMDQPLHPEQRISREQAIRLYTSNNAYLLFGEKEKGSLETGKLADFVIVPKDPLTCSLEELRDMKPEATYLGGRQVYP